MMKQIGAIATDCPRHVSASEGLVDRWKLLGAIAADKELPPAAATVAYWQLDYFGDRGSCLGVESLELLTGRDRRTVQRAVRALVKAGYFREVSKGGRRGGRGHTNVLWPKCPRGAAYHAEAKARMPERASTSPPFSGPAGNDDPDDTGKGVNPDQKGRQDCPERASTSPPHPSCSFPPEKSPPASDAPCGAERFSSLEGEKPQKSESEPERPPQADPKEIARQRTEALRKAREEREERVKRRLCRLAECDDDMFGADGEAAWEATSRQQRDRWIDTVDNLGSQAFDAELLTAIEAFRENREIQAAAAATADRIEALAGTSIPAGPDRSLAIIRIIRDVDRITYTDRLGAQRRWKELVDRQRAGTLQDEELQPYAECIKARAA